MVILGFKKPLIIPTPYVYDPDHLAVRVNDKAGIQLESTALSR